jgi:hypothetical protein
MLRHGKKDFALFVTPKAPETRTAKNLGLTLIKEGLSYLPTLTPQIQAQSRAIPTHRAFLEYLLSWFPTKINPFREANPL